MKTSVKVTMDLLDRTAIQDSTPSATNNSSFADINKLKEEHNEYLPFMTLEHNVNILDGSLTTFDTNNTDFSYFSSTLSDNNCISNNVITVDFGSLHSIAGVVLDFGDISWIDKITLTYLLNGKVLKSNDFYPTSSKYRVVYGCIDFNQIKISLDTTKFPNMYTRLQHIQYGFIFDWKNEDIIECTVLEEVQPLSSTIPVNTCSVTINDIENDFNILNPNGIYNFLNSNIKLEVYGIYNDKEIPFGKYHLDTWNGDTPYIIKFDLISEIGLLDRKVYSEGGIIGFNSDYTAYSLLEEVLNNAGLVKDESYTISEDLKDTPVMGLLPNKTYRDVIQHIAFTANACVDDTRDGIIKIYRTSQDIKDTLEPNKLFIPVNVTRNEPITQIQLSTHYFDLPYTTNYVTVFNGFLNANESKRIITSTPIYTIRYQKVGAQDYIYPDNYTIGKYYFDFTANESSNYIIQILAFNDISTIQSRDIPHPEIYGKVKENILKIEEATLLFNSGEYWGDENVQGNVEKFLTNLTEFYTYNTLKITCEYLNNGTIKCGNRYALWTEFNQFCIGTIVRQKINLSGGFITEMTMIANNKNLSSYYYATNGVDSSGMAGQYDLTSDNNILI